MEFRQLNGFRHGNGCCAQVPEKRRLTQIVVLGLLMTHAALLGWQAWRYSPTIDEPAHLIAGLSHWKFGRFDLYRVNPPLVRLVAALPMLFVDPKTDWSGLTEAPYARPEFQLGKAFANFAGFDVFWYFTLCRWACIPFSLVGAWICFCWARDLYGRAAGMMALVLWCFCPNILGNGTLITADVGASALGVAAAYCFWRWLREPNWTHALVAGISLGLAELTKSTWIILFALWPLIWIVWRFSRFRLPVVTQPGATGASPLDPSDVSPTSILLPRPSVLQLSAILLIALYVLNLGYGFENTFQRLDKFQFISHAFGETDAHKTPGNRFAGAWLKKLLVPVPANYLRGLDVQRYDFEIGKWSYLRGEQKMGGWWYYYLYAIVVKMPLGTLFLIAVAAVHSGARMIRGLPKPVDGALGCASRLSECDRRSYILDSITLLAPGLAILAVVSSQTGFNRYLRYVVPAFPFLFIWASQVTRLITARPTRGLTPAARPWRLGLYQCRGSLVIVPLALTITSSLAVFPHSLSYFNELVGGPINGPAHLLDANIDWGQDLLELKRWYDAHPQARPFHMTFFGLDNPRAAGLDFDPVPATRLPLREGGAGEVSPGTAGTERGLRPGWYALSVNELHGYKHFGDRPDQYARFRELRVVTRIGYSITIYHVAPGDATRLRRELGRDVLPPQPIAPRSLEMK